MKLSVCIPCKARLKSLQQAVLALLEARIPEIEIVILDWDCPESTADWALSQYAAEISSGIIRVGKVCNQKYFEASHTKNVAHLLATGEILMNCDAEHIWSASHLRKVYETMQTKIFYHVSFAHPTMRRGLFEYLGGYNEMYDYGWGLQDMDLGARASMVVPESLMVRNSRDEKRASFKTIKHSDHVRSQFRRLPRDVSRDINAIYKAWHKHNNEPVANHGKIWGHALVAVNGGEMVQTGKVADASAVLDVAQFGWRP